MKIVFVRHHTVDFKWARAYNSEGFDNACRMYDTSKIVRSIKPERYDGIVYTSNQYRTQETAKALFGNRIHIITTDLLNEVPLKSFMSIPIKFPTLLWMVVGRIQWFFNHANQTETRRASKNRIAKFLDFIQDKNQDCVVIGHGFYFAEFVKELKRRGASGDMNKRIRTGEKRAFIFNQI